MKRLRNWLLKLKWEHETGVRFADFAKRLPEPNLGFRTIPLPTDADDITQPQWRVFEYATHDNAAPPRFIADFATLSEANQFCEYRHGRASHTNSYIASLKNGNIKANREVLETQKRMQKNVWYQAEQRLARQAALARQASEVEAALRAV